MKKIFSLFSFIIIGLLFSFFIVSCKENKKLPKEKVIENFVENSKNIKSFNMISTILLEAYTENDDTLAFSSEISVITEPFTMKIDMSIPRINQRLKSYIKDGYRYTLLPNSDKWTKIYDRELDEYFKNYMDDNNEIYDTFKNNIDKITLEEFDDNYLITIPKNSGIFENIIRKQMKKLTTVPREMDIDNIFITYTIDKKTFLPLYSHYSADITIDDAVKINMKNNIEYRDINNIDNIELPKEVQEAEETKI